MGKGSGRRLLAQERRFGMPGEIVRWFHRESAAYNLEAKLIAKHKPVHNRCAGGGGAITRRKSIPLDPMFAEIERVGSRLFAGRELLKLDLKRFLPEAQIEKIRKAVFDLESNIQTV